MEPELFTERMLLKDVLPDKAKDIAKKYRLKEDNIEFIRKKTPLKAEDLTIEDGERAAIRYVNTADLDRDSEIVLPSGGQVDDFKKSPTVLYAHNYQGLPIGKDIWIKLVQGKGWLAKTVYAKHQLASDIYNLVKEKFLNTSSIGFIPLESVKPDDKDWGRIKDVVKSEYSIKGKIIDKAKKIYTKWIMLEHSDVPIPSNINALNIAVGKGLEIKSQELIDDLEIEIEDEVLDVDTEKVEEEMIKVTRELHKEKLDEKEVILKPEETDDYIRIPVRDCKVTATLTISAEQGIKALYCGKIKKVRTYLFAKAKKWTMDKAKKWVADHDKDIKIEDYIEKEETEETHQQEEKEEQNKGFNFDETTKEGKGITNFRERWNKSLSGNFDVGRDKEAPTTFEYNMFKEFLNCEVRNIFKNTYFIPSPLLGTYLAGFKAIFNEFELGETRNFSYSGVELPPVYEVIRLNSIEEDDFLIEGVQFYKADEKPIIMKVAPTWAGMMVSIITSNRHKDWNKKLLKEVHNWAKDNNYLRGEKFALSGEFLEKSEDDWKSLITEFNIKDAIKKSIYSLENKMKNLDSRGLLFIGVPGTGKTKTGRILLNNVDSTFIWVSSRDFLRGYNILSLAFKLARDLAPTVLFIEDIDTWLRGSIVDLLKTELDGLRQNKGIVTILTSNSPEKLPDALLDRPGRFHHVLRFPLPNAEFRKEMINSWVGDIDEKILNKIVEKTEHFSGAHIKELVDFAKIIADEEEVEIGEALLRSLDRLMAQRELIEEIRENKKGLKETVLDKIVLKAGAVLNKKNKADLKEAQAKIQNVLDSSETAEPIEEDKQAFECECLKCGHKLTSDKHCDTLKCPKCGGKMRRAERPGPGKEADVIEIEDEQELEIEEDEKEEKLAEEKKETIDIDEKELAKIVHDALEEQISKSTEKISKEIREDMKDNFKRMTGKVM